MKIWEPYHIYKFITGRPKEENVNNVFYTSSKKAGPMHRLSVWIRSNFFIPDARCFWIKPSVKYLLEYLKENPVDAIFSDGPPHSNTRIATLLKKETGIPWLADFQDPWSQIDYYSLLSLTKASDAKHKRLEQEAFRHADKITIASPTWASELEQIGAKDVSWYPYGYDPEDFENLVAKPTEKFIISHMGIIGYDRNPEIFFNVIADLIDTNDDFKKDILLSFPGQVDHSVMDSIKRNKLEDYVELPGNLDRADALQKMKDSSILLLLLNKQENAKGRIPGKIYEYLASKRHILCLGPPDGDSSKIVIESEAGSACNYNDQSNIKDIILREYQQFKRGQVLKDVNSNVGEFSHHNIIKRIARYLDTITNN